MTTLQIDVLGKIGPAISMFDEPGFTSQELASRLSGVSGTVKLRINSPGGSCVDGLAIYNLLRQSGCRIEVEVLGVAASAASMIAMAGDSIAMAVGSMLMIHEPRLLGISGTSDDLREAADTLDRLKASYAEVYAARTGKSAEEISALLKAETWMNADEAIASGFAHSKLADSAVPLPAEALRLFPETNWEPLRAVAMIDEAKVEAAASRAAADASPSLFEQALAAHGIKTVEEVERMVALAKEASALKADLEKASAESKAAEAQATSLRSQLDQREREGIVAKLVAERKTCPAQADFLASLSLEALRAYALTAPVVVPQSKVTEAAHASDGVDRWNGKSWAELRKSPEDMRALFDADPELFKRMQTTAQKRR